MMTGQYAHTRDVPALHFRMDPEEHSLADSFNAAGYRSIYVGKWHLDGCRGRDPIPPQRQARWQRWLGFEVRNAPFDTFYFEDDDPRPHRIEGYQTDGLFSLAEREIEATLASRAEPFCCLLSVEPPHFPYEAPEEYLRRWRRRDIALPPTFETPVEYHLPLSHWPGDDTHTAEIKRERVRTYYAMIENLDDNVGRMMEFLQRRGALENTVVVALADHGEMGGAHGLPTAMKSYPFEESIGIPLIMRDPRIPGRRGAVVDEPVCTEDLKPTLCGLAGVAPGVPLPGTDLSPLVRGEVRELGRDGILLEHVRDEREPAAFYNRAYRGIRTREYKYTVLSEEGRPAEPWMLFDMRQDPFEQNNLVAAPSHTRVRATLHNRLCELLQRTGDAGFTLAQP
jgi:arylsulfatase A-like enzyme